MMLLKLGLGANNKVIAEGGGSGYLDDVISSVVADLDATISASYSGSGQTWANLIAAPADSAAQTDYDFWLGADGTADTLDPTFTGSAGSASAYWSFDGSDRFTHKTDTTLIDNLHKTAGDDFWLAITLNIPVSSGNRGLFATKTTGTTTAGFYLLLGTDDDIDFRQYAGGTAILDNAGATVTESADVIIITSFNRTTNKGRYWVSTTTAVENNVTFDTGTTDKNGSLTIGSNPNGSQALPAGSKVYSVAIGNEFLDDTKAGDIIAHLEARHGRDYTP